MSKLAYPIIGGPLDGQYATTDDFYDGSWRSGGFTGMYAHLSKEYREFNRAGGGGRPRIGSSPSMVFIHTSLLKPMISPKDR